MTVEGQSNYGTCVKQSCVCIPWSSCDTCFDMMAFSVGVTIESTPSMIPTRGESERVLGEQYTHVYYSECIIS